MTTAEQEILMLETLLAEAKWWFQLTAQHDHGDGTTECLEPQCQRISQIECELLAKTVGG